MTNTNLWDSEFAKCKSEFPKFRVRRFDDNWFSRLFWKLFSTASGVTFWNTIYVDPALIGNDRGAELLAHEIVHVRDQHRWNVLFFLSYLFLPIGPGLRAIWEWRAYKETLRWIHEHMNEDYPQEYKDYIEDYYCQWVAHLFSGPNYLWMWPFYTAMYKKAKNFVDSLT